MNVKKLLVLGAVNPGAIENMFIAGFLKLGIEVERFDIYDRYIKSVNSSVFNKVVNKISPGVFYQGINRDVIDFISKKTFDVVLVFKGMELFPETLARLKKHTGLLANYNPDHPFIYFFPGSGNSNVLQGIPFYDVHFSYAKSIVERLKTECNKCAFCIPFGFNSNLPLGRETSSNLNMSQFVFIGAYDKERLAYLDALKNPTLHIYGDDKWQSRSMYRPYIRQAFQQRSLYGKEYMEVIRNAPGVINLLREQNLREHSHNMRTFEVPGFGGLLISHRTSEQQEYFEEDKEAVYFDTMDELRSKLDFLSGRPSLITAMKQAAYERASTSGYSYDDRSRQLVGCLKNLN